MLRHTNDRGALSYSVFIPHINQSLYIENYNIERKGKIGKLTVPFHCSSSLLLHELKVESVGRICTYQEVIYF